VSNTNWVSFNSPSACSFAFKALSRSISSGHSARRKNDNPLFVYFHHPFRDRGLLPSSFAIQNSKDTRFKGRDKGGVIGPYTDLTVGQIRHHRFNGSGKNKR